MAVLYYIAARGTEVLCQISVFGCWSGGCFCIYRTYTQESFLHRTSSVAASNVVSYLLQ